MPAKVVLEVTAGPIQGQSFTLTGHETFLFGRHNSCHARIAGDGLVSRHHFLIEANPPHAVLRDLGSLNGTFVNGTRYWGRANGESAGGDIQAEVDLADGDKITVGNTTIVVRVVVPALCAECGAGIPDELRGSSRGGDDSYVCQACHSALATAQPFSRQQEAEVATLVKAEGSDDSTRQFLVNCEHCQGEVSVDLRTARGGRVVCESCRTKVLNEETPSQELVHQLHLDDYEFEKLLGRGGEGVVFLARRKDDNERVAIKILLSQVAVEEQGCRAFLREVEITKRLQHKHIVKLLDSGGSGGTFYFVMEYCNGGSLAQLIQRQGGKLPIVTALPFMLHCLAGLDFAHRSNVVHRDLKPHNILLEQGVKGWVAKIGDLGLAKSFEMAGFSGMTTTGTVGGTVYYMPREQITQYRYVRPASDVWSMAATFYFMLTGTYPLDFPKGRDPMEIVLRDEPIPLAHRGVDIPAAVGEVIDKALAMEPNRRFASATEMQHALRQSAKAAGLS